MRKKRSKGLSRLTMAWLGLLGVIALAAVGITLLPAPEDPTPVTIIDLPRVPEKYAAAESFPEDSRAVFESSDDLVNGAETAEIIEDRAPTPETDVTAEENAPESVEEALAASGSGAVVITVPEFNSGSGLDRVRGPQPYASDLTKKTVQGLRPATSAGGQTPFDRYRRMVPERAEQRRVSVIVSGLGIDPVLAQEAIERLPANVTLSFAPYTKNLEQLVEQATADGHEVVIEIPMESKGVPASALGPAALMTSRSEEANHTRLEWILSRAPAYPMVTNYLGHTFSGQPPQMRQVLQTVQASGLAYIDDTGLAMNQAEEMGVQYARVAAVLPPGTPDVEDRLGRLASRAVPGTLEIAKVYASDGGVEAVANWVEGLSQQEIELVPASAAVE